MNHEERRTTHSSQLTVHSSQGTPTSIKRPASSIQHRASSTKNPASSIKRPESWTETVKAGWNQLSGADTDRIAEAVRGASTGETITEYGNGKSAQVIAEQLSTKNEAQ